MLREQTVTANGVGFSYLESGPADGPLALCLHGFPDSARTWRHLLPALADAGFHAVAPWMRGFAPTEVPADGRYQTGALATDATALHEALGGDGRAVLIGHDWGAQAAYGAATWQPERWRKVVAAAVPPAVGSRGFLSYDQMKRSWYIYVFQQPFADAIVAADDLAFIARLWADWSPGYDATEDLVHVRQALGTPDALAAALGYYRAVFGRARHEPELAEPQAAVDGPVPQPTLYLHGTTDGCMGAELAAGSEAVLGPGSRVVVVEGAGHFLHLERPAEVNGLILEFLAS